MLSAADMSLFVLPISPCGIAARISFCIASHDGRQFCTVMHRCSPDCRFGPRSDFRVVSSRCDPESKSLRCLPFSTRFSTRPQPMSTLPVFAGANYCYQVTAVLNEVESAPSNQVAAARSPAATPAPPTQEPRAHRGPLVGWRRCVAAMQRAPAKKSAP